MRNKRTGETIDPAARRNARYEVLPTASTEDKVLAHLPRDVAVTVTASPTKGLEATLDLAERLAGARLHRRAPPGRADDHRAQRARGDRRAADRQGHRRIFVPGGDAEPAGDYPDALALLADLTELGRPFAHVGVTGYPESHPTIHDDLIVQAMWDKRRHATHVVSNLTFDPAVVRDWIHRLRARGRHDAAAARRPGAGRAHQAAGDGDPDRGR